MLVLLQSETSIITNCDSFDVLQSRTIITADADGADFLFYKLRQGEL